MPEKSALTCISDREERRDALSKVLGCSSFDRSAKIKIAWANPSGTDGAHDLSSSAWPGAAVTAKIFQKKYYETLTGPSCAARKNKRLNWMLASPTFTNWSAAQIYDPGDFK